MTAMTLRGLDEKEAERLRQEASRQGISLNSLLLRLVREGAGLVRRPWRRCHNDLDPLAGTWTDEEAAAFMAAIEETGRIDPEMWK